MVAHTHAHTQTHTGMWAHAYTMAGTQTDTDLLSLPNLVKGTVNLFVPCVLLKLLWRENVLYTQELQKQQKCNWNKLMCINNSIMYSIITTYRCFMEKQTLCSVHGVACWDYTTSLSQYFSLKEVNFVRACVRSPSLHGDNGGGG